MLRLVQLALAPLAAAALAATSAPAHAQLGGTEATAVREGFEVPRGDVTVLVFRPHVSVGSQTAGGMNEPNVEWTEAARAHMAAALRDEARARGVRFAYVDDPEGPLEETFANYSALFRTVAQTAFQHSLFPGSRLPTKRKRFDYTLGEGVAPLRSLGGDYALFFYTHDSYGSTGRKLLQGLGLVLGGGLLPSGVHVGYAGLVDLKTGDMLWLNADVQMGGDVRTADGARKRVAQLLEEFPLTGSPGAVETEGVPVADPIPNPSQTASVIVQVPPEEGEAGDTAAPPSVIVVDEDGEPTEPPESSSGDER